MTFLIEGTLLKELHNGRGANATPTMKLVSVQSISLSSLFGA